MIADHALIAWLVMYDYASQNEQVVYTPTVVVNALLEKGWLAALNETRWDGVGLVNVTPAGRAIIDIHAPDYGLDTIPEESDVAEE